jgi:GntR family transcriptional regulator
VITFRLSSKSAVPPYLQIVEEVRRALLAGRLVPGDQLPTVKEVVRQVTVNPNTVLRAYRELEWLGLVEGRRGVGTFVVGRPQGPSPIKHAALARGLDRWIAQSRDAGLDDSSIESMVRSALQSLSDEDTA